MSKDISQLELRSITADEWPTWSQAVELHFGAEAVPARTERERAVVDYERAFAALDGPRIVGNAGVFSFTVSLPGAAPVPCAGVTAVGVATDWRRRGLLRRMMRLVLDQAHDRGEPFAALYASEAPIYGRFGFGIGAPVRDITVDTVRARLLRPVGTDDVELVDAATAIDAFPAIYDAARRQRGGMMSRSPAWWRMQLEHDDADRREGYSPRFHAHVPGRGYALYRWKADYDGMTSRGDVRVEQLIATDPEAESALWELLFGVDLTVSVTASMRPSDDALLYLVDDRYLARDRGGEHLYLRLVDVPAALTSRRYDHDGVVTFTVTDEMCSWNAGTWRLEVRDGDATCDKVDGHGDLALDVSDLAAISLGGLTPSALAWARRISERTPGAVLTAQGMFAVDRAPWNPFEF